MKLASALQSVTVYRAGAVCLRTATAPPTEALRRYEVCGLPLATVAGSIRAGVESDEEDVRVIDVRPGFDVAIGEASDLSVEAQTLAAAEEECGRLSLEVDRLERQIAELRGLVPRFREPEPDAPPRTANLDALLSLAEFVDERLATIAQRRREVALALADARERQRSAAARLQEATSASRALRTQVSRTAIVTLSSAPSRACKVTIEYEVPGARWAPTYHLMLGDGDGGRLVMRAAIAQRTGEDWSAVRLSLSTASLRRDVTMPELRALRIGRNQAAPPRAGWRDPPSGLDALFADFDAARARIVPPRTHRHRDEEVRTRARPVNAPPPPSMPPPPAPPPMAPMAAAPMAMSAPAPGAMPQARRAAPSDMARQESEVGASRGGGGAPRSTMAFGAVLGEQADEESPAFDDGGDGYAAAPEAPAGPSSEQLDYRSQRMQGPSSPQRGRLLPAAVDLLAVGVHVEVSVVVAALATASSAASGIGHLALPPEHVAVSAIAGFDYRFDARAPADVPSTGTWTTIGVMDCAVAIAARYVAVPAVDSAVYRTIELTNRSSHALLPGPLDVSRGGKFLVTTSLAAIAPGAVGRRIGLGVEESIAIARNTRYAETTSGLFGGTVVLAHDIDIEIDNRLGVEVEIDVRERIPVVDGGEKDVKIEETTVKPGWVAVDEPEDGELVHGLRRWRVRVAARSKTNLVGGYHVRLPSDRMLVGGNRRA